MDNTGTADRYNAVGSQADVDCLVDNGSPVGVEHWVGIDNPAGVDCSAGTAFLRDAGCLIDFDCPR